MPPDPDGVRASVPGPAPGAPGSGEQSAGDRQPATAGGHDREGALGRDAPQAAGGARPDPRAAAGAAGRADGWPRPAGAPGAVDADRRPAGEGRDGADEHALHRGGRAPGGHGGGDVERADHRPGHAGGAGEGACGRAGARGLWAAGAPCGGGRAGGRERLVEPAQRPGGGDPAGGGRWTAWRPRACAARRTWRMRSWR